MDEKQLQFLYSEYAKNKGFKDYSEFKGLMSSEGSRKLFFDDANTELGFKDYNEFNDLLGLKKKAGGEISSPSKSQLLLPDFEKGKTFAEKGFLMKPEGTKEEIIETPDNQQGLLLNLVSSLDKGFAKNFISSPIKGLGTVLQGTTKKVLGGTGEGYISDKLIKYGDYLNNAIDELTPQDEEFKGTLLDQAAQAVGQIGSLVLTGGLTGAAGKGAALVSQAPKGAAITAAKTLGSQLSSPTAVSAGLSMGQAEFDRAIQAGATDDQAFEAFYKNAAVGSVLETIPVMQFFKRFNNATAGSVANYIKTKGVAGLTGGIEEMTTEVMQQLYANKTAKDIYNINQDILDGVGSSGGVGFGIGFLLNALGANAKILRKQGKVQEADVLENQVKQYEDNLEKPKVTSGNKVSAKDIVTQGPEIGTQKAVKNLDRDLANNVITPEQYQQGIVFAEKAAQVADKIPETVIGESRAKSMELLVERNDIKQANQILLEQKQTTDEAYHAGIDEEIKANDEKIKKLDAEVYNIAKKPSKDFGDKKYIVDGEEVSKEAFEALQGKPIGTKTIIKAEVKPEEVKVTEEVETVKLDELPDRAFAVGMTVEKFEDLKSKIQKEGFTQPIIIDKESGNVLDGQSRLLVAQDLGIKDVPYIFMDNPARADLNEKIKELEKQYIPSEEVKPTEVKEAPKKTYQEALKEKQAAEKKQTRQAAGEKAAVTRKTIEESNKIEASDARSAALKYLTGGKLSWDAINEVAGRVKRATLNTGVREFKSEEARSRDYVAKKGEGESLDEAADSIWNDLSEEIQNKMDTQDVKNALMMAVSEYNSKAEMAKALIDGYKEESIEELENKYYERFGDNAEIEIDKELNQVPKNQLDIEQELINANYESEQQFQDDYWNTKEATNNFTEKAPSAKAQKAETAKGLAEAYKDLTINQKRQIINSKFDELLKELKIEKICPT
jgi:ParB-like chromosome segregation protein Spo0J